MSDPNTTKPKTPTVFRDPRSPLPLDGGPHRIYVISHPDPMEAKSWGVKSGIPGKYWEEKLQRLKVQGPYLHLAMALPNAPKPVIEERANASIKAKNPPRTGR